MLTEKKSFMIPNG